MAWSSEPGGAKHGANASRIEPSCSMQVRDTGGLVLDERDSGVLDFRRCIHQREVNAITDFTEGV